MFQWTPDPPPAKKKKPKAKTSLLAGFGSSAVVEEEPVKVGTEFQPVHHQHISLIIYIWYCYQIAQRDEVAVYLFYSCNALLYVYIYFRTWNEIFWM